MATRRLDKTLADYVGIAISPVLIMVLIGSLMFFLLAVTYEGEYAGRLRWTTFWFVLASVLISRISIEQGSTHAGMYGFALAIATGLMVSRFVNFVFGVWCFLAFIWWCASKLTWDCTLIDDDEDASGEGLLQVGRLDESSEGAKSTATAETPAGSRIPLWRQLFKNRSERTGQPHAPGLWVVYFSLVALPLFGAGQLLIPRDNPSARRFGFLVLWIYTAAALGLLLTTSFLGLRRYLRQRRLQMAPEIARTWIGFGATLAAAILLCCVLLPRPEAEYSLTALINKMSSPDGAASDYSFFRRSSETGEEANIDGARDGDERRMRKTRGTETGEDGPGDTKADHAGQDSSKTTKSGLSAFGTARLLSWILYALFVGLAVYWLIRKWPKIAQALRQWVHDFIAFWRKLFGLELSDDSKATAIDSPRRPVELPSFSKFANPFATGKARHMSVAELICYSFDALQACARECGVPRRPEQTPLEFGSVLSRAVPALQAEAPKMTQLYTRLAYSRRPPSENSLDGLERLWREMTSVAGGNFRTS